MALKFLLHARVVSHQMAKFIRSRHAFANSKYENVVYKNAFVDIAQHIQFETMVQRKPTPLLSQFNGLLYNMARRGNYPRAVISFKELFRNMFPVCGDTLQIITRCYTDLKLPEVAVGMLSIYEKKGIHADEDVYTLLLRGFAEEGGLEEAWRYYTEIRKITIRCDQYVHDLMIHMYCEHNQLQSAVSILGVMKQEGYIMKEVRQVVDSYITIINAYCSAGEFTKAQCVFYSMRGNGFSPDMKTINGILDKFVFYGKKEEALLFFRNLTSVDPVSYTILIREYAIAGESRWALVLYFEMLKKGFRPNDTIYTLVLECLCKTGGFKEAFAMLKGLMKAKVNLGIHVYNVILEALCKDNLLDTANRLFKDLETECIEPNLRSYELILAVNIQNKCFEEAEYLFLKMCRSRSPPDVRTFNMLVREYIKIGSQDYTLLTLKKMADRKFSLDPLTIAYIGLLPKHLIIALIGYFERAGLSSRDFQNVEGVLKLTSQLSRKNLRAIKRKLKSSDSRLVWAD